MDLEKAKTIADEARQTPEFDRTPLEQALVVISDNLTERENLDVWLR